MKTKVLRAAEVAHVLRRALGPMRDWSDALADMRAEKTDVGGVRLLPVGVLSAGCRRPVYHPASVAEFINEVRLRCLESRKDAPLQAVEVEIDLFDERGWRQIVAKPSKIH